MLKNFDIRQEARDQEVEALRTVVGAHRSWAQYTYGTTGRHAGFFDFNLTGIEAFESKTRMLPRER